MNAEDRSEFGTALGADCGCSVIIAAPIVIGCCVGVEPRNRLPTVRGHRGARRSRSRRPDCAIPTKETEIKGRGNKRLRALTCQITHIIRVLCTGCRSRSP